MSDLKLLDGVKVVDMSAFVAAPMAAEILAEYGADVVRIEPLTGDGIRGSGMTISPTSLRSITATAKANASFRATFSSTSRP